jgi:hypothetical protein
MLKKRISRGTHVSQKPQAVGWLWRDAFRGVSNGILGLIMVYIG